MSPRSGRRPGSPATREAILDAARTAFTEHGYDGATIRGVATRAGVDPALVHHYFATKDVLFAESVRLPFAPGAVVAGLLMEGADDLGFRLVGRFVEAWDAADRSPLLALLRSMAAHPPAARMVRELVAREILEPVAQALGAPDAALRASLAGSQMLGLAVARYVVELEPLASASRDDLAALVGPTLQRYLTGDLVEPAQPRSPVEGSR